MNQCRPLSRNMLPNPVDVDLSSQTANFDKAKDIADEKARAYAPGSMLLAWFDRTTGQFSPQVTCCGDEKPTWLVYAESRGADLSVIVNDGQYVFVYRAVT